MRIKELLFDVKELTVYCESFVYEPSNVEEEKLGHLFMLGRIRNSDESSFYLINLLASRIKREYYNSLRRSANEAFELALKEANKVLKDNEDRINWLGNLDFFVASVVQNRIYFTLLGKMRAFILRSNEVVDLVQNLIPERDVLFPFSTVIQGALKKDDVLIFSTSNIFSKEKLLTQGAQLFPLEEKKLKELIETDESGVALVVETGKTAEVIERFTPSLSPQKSLLKVPSLSPEKKEKIATNFQTISQNSKIFFKTTGEKIKNFFVKIPILIKKWRKPTTPKQKETIPSITLEKVDTGIKFNWPKIKKTLLKKEVIIPLCVLIIGLIGFGISQSQKNLQITSAENTISTVEEKKQEAENKLIYGEKENALSLFGEALELLNTEESLSWPEEQKEKADLLKKDLENRISEITGRKILSDISPLFEIKEGVEKWKPQGIIIEENNIYIFSNISNLVYKWDIKTKEGIFLPLDAEGILGATIVNNVPIFLSNTKKIVLENEKTLNLSFPYEINLQNNPAIELDNFQNNFYIFDQNKGEIIKYPFSESEIGNGTLWFKEREIGKESVSVAIDGSIFLLQQNGAVKKFSAGSLKEEITSPDVFPKIKNATKIFTSPNNNYLYILEPEEKRVVVVNKKGEMVVEYQSEKFENLIDLWATPQDKKIYLLSINEKAEDQLSSATSQIFEIEIEIK